MGALLWLKLTIERQAIQFVSKWRKAHPIEPRKQNCIKKLICYHYHQQWHCLIFTTLVFPKALPKFFDFKSLHLTAFRHSNVHTGS